MSTSKGQQYSGQKLAWCIKNISSKVKPLFCNQHRQNLYLKLIIKILTKIQYAYTYTQNLT